MVKLICYALIIASFSFASNLMSSEETKIAQNYSMAYDTNDFQSIFDFVSGMSDVKIGHTCIVNLEDNYALVIYELKNDSPLMVQLSPFSPILYSVTIDDASSFIISKRFDLTPVYNPDKITQYHFDSSSDPIIKYTGYYIKKIPPGGSYSYCFITRLNCNSKLGLTFQVLDSGEQKYISSENEERTSLNFNWVDGDSIDIINYCP